ncbi:aminotransferase class V-fold PLP-dependent enzyme [Cytobacillus sp.]|uniref:aminotransferase class V-fold PLP-dependent enzyme n=1 Tax=Cytobacillus sp. TaxID=2675269 RepID=UPI0028BD9E3B|nr:aminotransferase class V-fold PLP-dependent enzyme [Cytobacillus sp.]
MGPATLPLEVFLQIQDEFLDLQGTSLSILEKSSKVYENINGETQQLLKDLLNIPTNYEMLFLQGVESTQFAMVPMNFLVEGM